MVNHSHPHHQVCTKAKLKWIEKNSVENWNGRALDGTHFSYRGSWPICTYRRSHRHKMEVGEPKIVREFIRLNIVAEYLKFFQNSNVNSYQKEEFNILSNQLIKYGIKSESNFYLRQVENNTTPPYFWGRKRWFIQIIVIMYEIWKQKILKCGE